MHQSISTAPFPPPKPRSNIIGDFWFFEKKTGLQNIITSSLHNHINRAVSLQNDVTFNKGVLALIR